jgi:hypothetical protein
LDVAVGVIENGVKLIRLDKVVGFRVRVRVMASAAARYIG